MKITISIFSLLVAAILTGCATTSPHRDFSGMPATEIVVTVACSNPGIKFAGTIVTDGHSVKLSGTGRGTFHATGHEFVCSFRKTEAYGQISISVSEGGKELGNSYSVQKYGGVRAEVLRTPLEQHDIFTTLN